MAAKGETPLMKEYRARARAAGSLPAKGRAHLERVLRKARRLLSR
jgi:hypothetical protein